MLKGQKKKSVSGQDESGKEKPPNHGTYPVNGFSLTIVKRGGDISISNYKATEWGLNHFV